jgi:hypothetical protein
MRNSTIFNIETRFTRKANKMKKYVAILGILTILSTSAHAETCAGGAGTVIYGNDADRTPYCKSNITINWWSAFAWCDAIGGELIDLTTECNKSTGTSACPNLTGIGSGSVWTRNVPNGNVAYDVSLSSGAVLYGYGIYRSDSKSLAALCVDF